MLAPGSNVRALAIPFLFFLLGVCKSVIPGTRVRVLKELPCPRPSGAGGAGVKEGRVVVAHTAAS
jgi:hypothetical protein